MRYVVIAVLALVLGAFVARSYYTKDEPEPVDPINVIVMQMKTHAIVEHEPAGGGVVSGVPGCRGHRSGDLHRMAGKAVLRAGAE
jgi:hypothetical protein